jgi:hypothetical protein
VDLAGEVRGGNVPGDELVGHAHNVPGMEITISLDIAMSVL